MFDMDCYHLFLLILAGILEKGYSELDAMVSGKKSWVMYTTYRLLRKIVQRRKKILHSIKGFIHRMLGSLSSDIGVIDTGSLGEYMRVHRLDTHDEFIPRPYADLGLWLPLGCNFFRFRIRIHEA